MNERDLASIEYSKKLGFLFKDSTLYWERTVCAGNMGEWKLTDTPQYYDKYLEHIVAITSDMVLNKLKTCDYESTGFPCLQVIYMKYTKEWSVHFRNPPLVWVKKGSQDVGKGEKLADAACGMLYWIYDEFGDYLNSIDSNNKK